MNHSFTASHSLRHLIHEHPETLMLLRRFNISLGFGNATIQDVCAKAGIDTDTFLAVANLTCGRPYQQFPVSLPDLMQYLKNAHQYFLDFALPSIRRKLLEALPVSDPNAVTMLILRYFDDYVDEVSTHMAFEDETVFPYVQALLRGEKVGKFNIANFEASHEPLAPKLQELKEIFIFHYKSTGNEDLLNVTLYDIIASENDLMNHCRVEDTLLVPAVELLARNTAEVAPEPESTDHPAEQSELSAREREVVQCIARGLSTKEIAEALFLSVHTVNTHRRNICAKLDIHSAAGLAIYAIIHNLVDISEIRKSLLS